MRSGNIDRTIIVQRFCEAVDGYGVVTETWGDLVTLRAELLTDTTTETVDDTGASSADVLTFRSRYARDVRTSDRLLFDGAAYNIKAVAVVGRRRSLEIKAEKVS